MSRALYREWGAELSDDDFARALAARGALGTYKLPHDATAEVLISSLNKVVEARAGWIDWINDLPWYRSRGAPNARALASAWSQWSRGRSALRVNLRSAWWLPYQEMEPADFLLWHLAQLSRPAVIGASKE